MPAVLDLPVDWLVADWLVADWLVADWLVDFASAAAAAAAACVAAAASKTAGAAQGLNLLKMAPDSDQVPRWDVAFAGGAVAVAEFGSPCASLQLKWKQNYSSGRIGWYCGQYKCT